MFGIRPFSSIQNSGKSNNPDRLRTNEMRATLTALNKSQAVIHFNTDGTIIDTNTNFLAVFGYSLTEIQGKHHSLFVEPEYAKSTEYKAFWDDLRSGEFKAAEFKRIAKGGREVWIQATYNPIFDKLSKVNKVIKYATDITAQILKDADYRGQIEAISRSQAVIHFDTDGTIIDANTNFLAVFGYSLTEIQGKHHSLFVEPEYAKSTEYKAF